jgi:hypothetical protein
MSYAFLLISRVALMRRRALEMINLLRSARDFYERRDFVCHLRIGLGLSECLAADDPPEALRIAQAIKGEADSNGLFGVSELASRTVRVVRRHTRR